MPPEQTNTPAPTPAPRPTLEPISVQMSVPKKKNSRTLLVLIIVLLILITGTVSYAMYAGFLDRFLLPAPVVETQMIEKVLPTPNPHFVSGTQFYSNIENIQFTLPQGWAFNGTLRPAHPDGSANEGITLEKTGSACVIAVVDQSMAPTIPLKQISWATRVFSDYEQYDGNWWVASTSETVKYAFSNYERQPMPGEFRSSYNGDRIFLLWMKDGTAVSQECDTDLNQLLESVKPYFEQVKLDATSMGTVTTGGVRDNQSEDLAADDSYASLVFVADGLAEKREVMQLPNGVQSQTFSVVNNKLYVPANVYDFDGKEVRFDAAIYMIDPFSGQATVVGGSALPESYISSIYIKDQTIYYLAGDSAFGLCLDGYGDCAANLYSMPLTGGTSTLITNTWAGGSIWGYVESEQALYLARSSGDAGCGGSTITKVVNGKEELVGKYSACAGADDDLEYKEMQKAVTAIRVKAGAAKIESKALRVENGMLSPATGASSDDTIFSFTR